MQKRPAPVCWIPSRKRTSIEAPFASGVPTVTAPTPIEPLKPLPFGCDGGCSRVVPWTVTLLVPEPHGGRSTVTTTSVDVRGRRSATPEIDGNVETSTMRNRRRVMGAPELLVNVLRTSSVPNVELLGGSDVKSRTTFGTAHRFRHGSRFNASSPTPSREVGELRFSGPGAPRRWPAPAEVPLVSTKRKSAALLLVSLRLPPVGQGPKVVMLPPLPQLSR